MQRGGTPQGTPKERSYRDTEYMQNHITKTIISLYTTLIGWVNQSKIIWPIISHVQAERAQRAYAASKLTQHDKGAIHQPNQFTRQRITPHLVQVSLTEPERIASPRHLVPYYKGFLWPLSPQSALPNPLMESHLCVYRIFSHSFRHL